MRGVYLPSHPGCGSGGWVSKDVGQISYSQMTDGSNSLALVVPFSCFRSDSCCHSDLLEGPSHLARPRASLVADEQRPHDNFPRQTSPSDGSVYGCPRV